VICLFLPPTAAVDASLSRLFGVSKKCRSPLRPLPIARLATAFRSLFAIFTLPPLQNGETTRRILLTSHKINIKIHTSKYLHSKQCKFKHLLTAFINKVHIDADLKQKQRSKGINLKG